jgi:hypothetical protein
MLIGGQALNGERGSAREPGSQIEKTSSESEAAEFALRARRRLRPLAPITNPDEDQRPDEPNQGGDSASEVQ